MAGPFPSGPPLISAVSRTFHIGLRFLLAPPKSNGMATA
jgi:hypothetical protein